MSESKSQQENVDAANVKTSKDETVRVVGEKHQSDPVTEKTAEGYVENADQIAPSGDTGPLSPKTNRPAGPPNDWNPRALPSDGSPVMTTVGRDGPPASGQTGHKPKTVEEHNAEVKALSEPGVATNREKRTRLP